MNVQTIADNLRLLNCATLTVRTNLNGDWIVAVIQNEVPVGIGADTDLGDAIASAFLDLTERQESSV